MITATPPLRRIGRKPFHPFVCRCGGYQLDVEHFPGDLLCAGKEALIAAGCALCGRGPLKVLSA